MISIHLTHISAHNNSPLSIKSILDRDIAPAPSFSGAVDKNVLDPLFLSALRAYSTLQNIRVMREYILDLSFATGIRFSGYRRLIALC